MVSEGVKEQQGDQVVLAQGVPEVTVKCHLLQALRPRGRTLAHGCWLVASVPGGIPRPWGCLKVSWHGSWLPKRGWLKGRPGGSHTAFYDIASVIFASSLFRSLLAESVQPQTRERETGSSLLRGCREFVNIFVDDVITTNDFWHFIKCLRGIAGGREALSWQCEQMWIPAACWGEGWSHRLPISILSLGSPRSDIQAIPHSRKAVSHAVVKSEASAFI